MYESTGLPLLRFYLCASPNVDDPLSNSQKPDLSQKPGTDTLACETSQAPHTAASPSELAGPSRPIMPEILNTAGASATLFEADTIVLRGVQCLC